MTERDSRGRFRPGSTGNRRGRPPGNATRREVRDRVGDRLGELIDRLMQSALEGDTTAAKLILDRLAPSLRPVDAPMTLPPADDAPQTAQAVIAAMSAGEVTPGEANTALSALRTATEITMLAELRERIEALESQQS